MRRSNIPPKKYFFMIFVLIKHQQHVLLDDIINQNDIIITYYVFQHKIAGKPGKITVDTFFIRSESHQL